MIKENFFSLSFEAVIVFLIIFSPLFFGSVIPGAESIIQVAILILAVIFLAKLIFSDSPKIIFPTYSYLILAVLAVGLLQIFPLPARLLKVISPQTFNLYQNYLPDFNPAGSLTLGFYVPAVKRELFRAICFFLLFLITLNLVNEKKQCQRLILVIIFFGLGLSFYGVVNKFFILNKDIAHTFSTFGNRNNFSGYMIMVVPLTVGYALSCRQKAKKFLFGFIAALISASVLLSLSRAGSLSLFFSLFLMFILAKREKTHFKAYWLFPAVFAMGAIFIFMAGVGPIQERFGLFGSGLSGRIGLAKDSLGLVKDFPIFGIGWGNFQYLFTFYKQFVSTAHYYYLHNDHLQLVVEIGLIAASAYFYFLYRLFKDIFGQLEKRHDLFVKNIVIGGVSGTLGVFVHSFVEFNFHIPAILFLFWFILGLVYKCVYTHFE